jgi:hypothetical protein
MAVSTLQATDLTAVLEEILKTVPDLRVYRYVVDSFRPPGAIVTLPTITYNDPEAGYCASTWEFGVSLIVSRTNDRAAQDALSRMVSEVAQAVDSARVDGLVSLQMLTATPTMITVSGQESPAYNLVIQIRA